MWSLSSWTLSLLCGALLLTTQVGASATAPSRFWYNHDNNRHNNRHHHVLKFRAGASTPEENDEVAVVVQDGEEEENQETRVLTPAVTATSSSTTATATTPKNGPFQVFVRTIMDSRRHLAAAAVARTTSIFAMYPVDTIKTRMQMEQANALRLDGIYKGVAGSLFGQVPYGVLTFGSYEMYKRALIARFPHVKPVFMYALAAVMGDLTGSGWLCPSEVVKQQMQAGMYKTTGDAVRTIWQRKGFAGFYQGYLGGISRDVPFRVAQLTTYEVTKDIYLRIKRRRMHERIAAASRGEDVSSSSSSSMSLDLSPAEAALCGAIAGTFSAAITSPLDRIKTLLMTDSAGIYGGSVRACAAQIWKQEGVAGFMTGVVPRVTYIAPSVVIFFIVYEQVQQRLHHWQIIPKE